jgi:hypothetical protein
MFSKIRSAGFIIMDRCGGKTLSLQEGDSWSKYNIEKILSINH